MDSDGWACGGGVVVIPNDCDPNSRRFSKLTIGLEFVDDRVEEFDVADTCCCELKEAFAFDFCFLLLLLFSFFRIGLTGSGHSFALNCRAAEAPEEEEAAAAIKSDVAADKLRITSGTMGAGEMPDVDDDDFDCFLAPSPIFFTIASAFATTSASSLLSTEEGDSGSLAVMTLADDPPLLLAVVFFLLFLPTIVIEYCVANLLLSSWF